MYNLINVLPPSNFAIFNCCYFLCYWLQRAETSTNCLNEPALSIFEPNWYKWLHLPWGLLWVNSYVNEQKCKQRRHDESSYWIPNIMVKFFYLRLSLGIQTVSFRFLQRLARMDVNAMPVEATKKIFRLVFPEELVWYLLLNFTGAFWVMLRH